MTNVLRPTAVAPGVVVANAEGLMRGRAPRILLLPLPPEETTILSERWRRTFSDLGVVTS